MGTYAFSALLTSVSCYAGGVLLYKHSSRRHLSTRGMAILFLLAGFFLFTSLRSLTTDPHLAKFAILALYAHAIFLPSFFFDFTTLYTLSKRLRRFVMPLAYFSSALLLLALFRGTLINGIQSQETFSYYGSPGSSYTYYLLFIAIFTFTSIVLLFRSYFSCYPGKTHGYGLFILAIVLALATLTNTLLPTFGLPCASWLTYGGYLVPCLVLNAFYGYGFLEPKASLNAPQGAFLTRLATAMTTVILIAYVILSAVSHNDSFTFFAVIAAALLFGSGIYLSIALQKYHKSLTVSLNKTPGSHKNIDGRREVNSQTELQSLLDIINHDFRNVVVGLSLELKQLRNIRRATPKELPWDKLVSLEEDAKCLGEMINGISDIYAAEGLLSSARWHRLDTIVAEIEKQVYRRFPNRDMKFRYGQLPSIFAPRELIHLILSNLIANSAKYLVNKNDGLIEILGIKDKEKVTISISDNGVGIRPRELENIVKPFVRGSNNYVDGIYLPGRGIGLAIVHKLSLLMEWDVRIVSEHGVGTTVSIIIPCTQAQFVP